MKYGILSDIHSNLEALNAVVAQLQKIQVDHYLCAGDIVGYGADPAACIKRIQELKAISIAGNHDWAVAGKVDPDDFNGMAKAAVLWTRDRLNDSEKKYLADLPLIFQNNDLMMVHSTLPGPERFDYLNEVYKAVLMFQSMARNICFIGHTHVPLIIHQKNKTQMQLDEALVKVEPHDKYIVNVGSVGQSRDSDPQAAFCTYDTDKKILEIIRTPYDLPLTQQKIIKAGLPAQLATRLKSGH